MGWASWHCARCAAGSCAGVTRAASPSPLPDALRDSARALTAGTSLTANVQANDELPPLSADLEGDLLRVAQESITNAVKHARATTLTVSLHTSPQTVELRVKDDGVGFGVDGRRTTDAGRQGGFGLIGMRERVERHGGELKIESEPGKGTEIVCYIGLYRE